MLESMQELVDRLGITLQRSVQLDDSTFSLLTSSAHYGDTDAARMTMLVDRKPSEEHLEHLQGLRLGAHHDPVLVSAVPELGFEFDRLCVVLRSRYEVLGYLWLSHKTPLSEQDRQVVADATEILARILHNIAQSIEEVNAEVEAELYALLSPEQSARENAARELIDLGMFTRSSQFVALCLSFPAEWTQWGGPPPRELLFRALWHAISAPMMDSYTFGISTPDSFILIGYRNDPPAEALRMMGETIVREILALTADDEVTGTVPVVGIGAPVAALADSWQSYDQARVGAEVGRQQGESVAFWTDHPIAAAVSTLLAKPLEPHLLPEVLQVLAASSRETTDLLDSYFKHGGNVKALAEETRVHRATIYYRLKRIEAMLGVSIDDGDASFVIQAWLQQQRLMRQ